MALRLTAHAMPSPVLRHMHNNKQKLDENDPLSDEKRGGETEAANVQFYHSSVLHPEQGKSYFKANDGIVPTMAYRIPPNTHAITWY